MIPNLTIISFAIAAVFTLLVPAVILIIFTVKKKISAVPLLLGAAAFFISQVVLRMPILGALSRQEWYKSLAGNFILIVILLSLSAGLFEETARLGGAVLLKKRRRYKDIISFGLGHAFCEVILLIGITHINNIVLSTAINSNIEALEAAMSAETLKTVISQLTAVNPVHVYLGLAERFSAVIFHIFATMLVFKGVINKKWTYYVLAVIAHAAFNFTGVVLSNYAGVVVAEAVLFIMALAAGRYVLKNRQEERW